MVQVLQHATRVNPDGPGFHIGSALLLRRPVRGVGLRNLAKRVKYCKVAICTDAQPTCAPRWLAPASASSGLAALRTSSPLPPSPAASP